MQFRCSRGKYGRRDDDAWYPNEFVHGVGREITKLKHVQARFDRYLNFGNGLRSCFGAFIETALEGEQNTSRCFSSGILELRENQWMQVTLQHDAPGVERQQAYPVSSARARHCKD